MHKHPRCARLVKWVSFLHFFVRRNRDLTAWFLGTLFVITVVRKIEDYGPQALKLPEHFPSSHPWSTYLEYYEFLSLLWRVVPCFLVRFAGGGSALGSRFGSWRGLQLLTMGISHRVNTPVLAFALAPSPASEHATDTMNVALTTYKRVTLYLKGARGTSGKFTYNFCNGILYISVTFEIYLKILFDIFSGDYNLLAGAEAEVRCTLCAWILKHLCTPRRPWRCFMESLDGLFGSLGEYAEDYRIDRWLKESFPEQHIPCWNMIQQGQGVFPSDSK